MENGHIPDDSIIASSEWTANHGASNARLNRPQTLPTTGAWSAKFNDQDQWIQAYLGDVKTVSGVITQGRNGGQYRQWVTKFTVQYSDDDETWSDIIDANGERVRIKNNYNHKHHTIFK